MGWLLLQTIVTGAFFIGWVLQQPRPLGLSGVTTSFTAESNALIDASFVILCLTAVVTLLVAAVAVLGYPIIQADPRWVPKAGMGVMLVAFIVSAILIEIAVAANA